MKKKISITVFTFALILSLRLFCGVYNHDEFAESHFFIKHRPIWKWKFYSPLGMSDMKSEELSEEEQIEQKYFEEFIKERSLSL
ncbi:hypothetical protein SGQ83_05225 [Flavobacterium sp. Fl-318]|uniref:Uncharacterized protein n=1 Tax=Flavobacterium cupriresistens TaxID=2893885 RepID=A0ABU4R825_9FLAO|nr:MULTISPECIES: hypothetical protein [unclassified Flavobacterium]MDX6188742.1 hypothetical protein [Flavobacterium sp. Fl-318]UFH44471.1 hypothetical protein LNP23_09675 [Flavobacterium sp. F-323]